MLDYALNLKPMLELNPLLSQVFCGPAGLPAPSTPRQRDKQADGLFSIVLLPW